MASISSLPAKAFCTKFLTHISPSTTKTQYKLQKLRRQHRNSTCRADLVTEQIAPLVNDQLAAPLNVIEAASATSAVYGVLLLGGGLFAYTRSGSKGSLIGGASGAALMAAAYYLMQNPETKSFGDALGFGSSLLFSSVFVIRLVASRKLIPSGPLLGLSVGALAVFLSAYMQDKI
ncbi:Protein FATTY ACID EXPORT 4 [Ranunculus cassubicifolius]